MANFVPQQGEGELDTASKQTPQNPPVLWSKVVALFKTSSKPITRFLTCRSCAPLIKANTTLDQDKATLVLLSKSLGKSEGWLRLGNMMAASENVRSWWGVAVEGGRVTEVRSARWRGL